MLRELNKSLITHLTPLVQNTKDYYGNILDVPVLIKHPHMDLKTESYPCVTIQFLSSDVNLRDTNVNSYRVENSITPGKVDIISEPIIYNFNFQLDVWCKDPISRDAIVGSLMYRLPQRGLMNVEYNGGSKLPCVYAYRGIVCNDYTNEHNEVVFRNTITMQIQSPIFYENTDKSVVTVGSLDINIKNKED